MRRGPPVSSHAGPAGAGNEPPPQRGPRHLGRRKRSGQGHGFAVGGPWGPERLRGVAPGAEARWEWACAAGACRVPWGATQDGPSGAEVGVSGIRDCSGLSPPNLWPLTALLCPSALPCLAPLDRALGGAHPQALAPHVPSASSGPGTQCWLNHQGGMS